MRIAPYLAVLAAVCLAGCSSSGSTAGFHPGASNGIGHVVTPATNDKPVAAADLGKPITQGALTITVAGPVTTERDDAGLLATFHVTMTNTAPSGDVVGPDSFGVRCDANRDDFRPGDEMSTTTVAQDKHIAAGRSTSGVTVVAWLKWNSIAKCTGPTTIEARFLQGGYLSWTLPADVVAQVNTAGGM